MQEKEASNTMAKGFEYKEIGQRIKELRGRDRQKDWAERIGCDQGYISQVENGVTKPSLAFLKGVAAITSASIDWILTGRGSKSFGGERVVRRVDVPSPNGGVDEALSRVASDPELRAGVERLLNMDASGRALLRAIGDMDSSKVECLTTLLGKSSRR
jgi:transcriptional regulator with XRE-family HTH domain